MDSAKAVTVATADGAQVTLTAADAVIVATEGPTAARLLGPAAYRPAAAAPAPEPYLSTATASPNGTVCLYFAVPALPEGLEEPVLYLDGDGDRLVNNLCFPRSLWDWEGWGNGRRGGIW